MEHIGKTIKSLGPAKEIVQKLLNQETTLAGNTDTLLSPDCKLCKGIGSVHPVENGKIDYSRIIPCSCVKDILAVRRREALLRYCELPPMVKDMRFDNFKVYQELREAYEVAEWAARDVNVISWVTFMGNNDTGKTHLAVAICQAWIDKGVSAKYAYVPLLLDELKEGFGKVGSEGYVERFKRFCNVPLLVLDDLGAECSTSWVQEKLEAIVDYRYMNKLSLIVTTNKTIEELSPRLGSRLVRHPNARLVAIRAGEYAIKRAKK